MNPAQENYEPHYPLAVAATKFFPGGTITKRSLLTEIAKGRLQAIQIAGKYLVSEAAITAMKNAAIVQTKERVPSVATVNLPDSGSALNRNDPICGSSSTAAAKSALAAAQQTARELKGRFQNT